VARPLLEIVEKRALGQADRFGERSWGERSCSPRHTLKRTPGRRDATGGIREGEPSTAAAEGEWRLKANGNRIVVRLTLDRLFG